MGDEDRREAVLNLLARADAQLATEAASALAALSEAEALAADLEPLLRARVLAGKAWSQVSLGDPAAALQTLQGAESLLEAPPAPSPLSRSQVQAELWIAAAIVRHRISDYPAALELADRALQLCHQEGYQLGALRARNVLAIVLRELGDPAAALEHFQALRALVDASDPLRRAALLNNIGLAQIDAGALAEAEAALQEAEQLLAGNPRKTALDYVVAGNLAELQIRQGRLAEAEELLLRSMRGCEQAGYPAYQVNFARSLAALYLRTGRSQQAGALLAAALPRAEAVGSKDYQAQLHALLVQLHSERGEDRLALEHALAQHRLEREVFSEAAQRGRRDLLLRSQVEQLSKSAELERQRRLELEALLAEQRELKADLERLNAELSRQVQEDPLTGLGNRRQLELRLPQEIQRARRYHHPLSLAMADIDLFKRVNDTHSHALGDQVLQTVAQLLRGGSRETDLVIRYGGEEFVLVLIETDLCGAVQLCEKLRRNVAAYPWSELAPDLEVTCSFGVCSDLELPFPLLLAEADRQLYRAKLAGRNQVAAA